MNKYTLTEFKSKIILLDSIIVKNILNMKYCRSKQVSNQNTYNVFF